MEQFVQRFIQKYNITQQEADMLLAESVPVEFSRSEKIVNEGEINSDLYIVSHGVWRAYRLKDGIEMSMWFAIEGSLAFSVTGYAGEQASKLFIESLNRSRAHRISRHRLCELLSQSQEWADLGRRLIEQHAMYAETEWNDLWAVSAKERYLCLLKKMPELIQQIPLKHLASYLSMTPQSLSSIRASLGR